MVEGKCFGNVIGSRTDGHPKPLEVGTLVVNPYPVPTTLRKTSEHDSARQFLVLSNPTHVFPSDSTRTMEITSHFSDNANDMPRNEQINLHEEEQYSFPHGRQPFYRRRWFLLSLGGFAIVLIAIGIMGSKTSSKGTSVSMNSLRAPEVQVSQDLFEANKKEFGSLLVTYYDEMGFDWTPLGDANSPQGMALQYTCGHDQYAANDRTQNLQTYALATFYYATFGQKHVYFQEEPFGWAEQSNWITSRDYCQWQGVECTGGAVTGIILEENQLLGVIPQDIALLKELVVLDLTTNYLYADESNLDWLSYMNKLEELDMDDNYVYTENGLPRQIADMASLEHINLSYNLLQGPLDNAMFANLAQLTHLEIESNYLTGQIPIAIQKSTSLIYLYIRRNEFTIDLPSLLKAGHLPNIFALWLDKNNVTGRIPTTIGLLTDMASFSLTDTFVSGPIPTEMGNIARMQRIWLYDNELTGTIPPQIASWSKIEVFEVKNNNLSGSMPSAICQTVQASNYQFKALTADCAEVHCPLDTCCTECY